MIKMTPEGKPTVWQSGGLLRQRRLMKYEFIFRDRGRQVIRSAEKKNHFHVSSYSVFIQTLLHLRNNKKDFRCAAENWGRIPSKSRLLPGVTR